MVTTNLKLSTLRGPVTVEASDLRGQVDNPEGTGCMKGLALHIWKEAKVCYKRK